MHPFMRNKRKAPAEKVSLDPCPRCGNNNVHLTDSHQGNVYTVRCGWGLVGCGTLFTTSVPTDRPGAAAAYNEWARLESKNDKTHV